MKLSAPTVALAVAHVGSDFAQGAVPAVGAVFAAHGLVDLGQVGVLVFAVNAGSSVLQPVLGVIADRTGWAWTAVAGVVVAAAGLCGLGAAPGFSGMVVATVLCGIGVAAFHPEAGRLVRASAGVDMSARAMSVFALGGNIGFALGPIVAAPAAMAAGAAGVCALAAIPVAAAVPLMWVIRAHSAALSAESVPVSSGPADQPPYAADGSERWLGFGCLGVVITLRSAGYYSLQAFVPAYLATTFAVTSAAGAQGLTVLVVAGTAATMVGGWRARRTPHIALISWPLVAVAAATLALLWAPTYLVALIALAAAGAATFAGFGGVRCSV